MTSPPTPPTSVGLLDRLAETAEGLRRELDTAKRTDWGKILVISMFLLCLVRIATLYVRYKGGLLTPPRTRCTPGVAAATPQHRPHVASAPAHPRRHVATARDTRPMIAAPAEPRAPETRFHACEGRASPPHPRVSAHTDAGDGTALIIPFRQRKMTAPASADLQSIRYDIKTYCG